MPPRSSARSASTTPAAAARPAGGESPRDPGRSRRPADARKTVVLLLETSRAYGRGVCQGVARYAREHPEWSIVYQERSLRDSVPAFLRRGQVDGILMRVDRPQLARQIAALHLPTVDLLGEPTNRDVPVCFIDDDAVARLGADYFLQNGFSHFAFCGYPGIPFSDRRERTFRDALATLGRVSAAFPGAGRRDRHRHEVRRAEQAGFQELPAIAAWLRTLPQPVGLLACNDVRALQVVQACRLHGLVVPDQVAVLGVDDDEIIIDLSQPSLSSIKPNTIATGYQACVYLDQLMRGEPVTRRADYTAPVGVVERASTDMVATPDQLVARALRRIRQRAGAGLSVKTLVNELGVSRAGLDGRFRKALGRTVHDEISRLRLKQVCERLAASDEPLSAVAAKTGFLGVSHLSHSFRKAFGVWPGAYRALRRAGREQRPSTLLPVSPVLPDERSGPP